MVPQDSVLKDTSAGLLAYMPDPDDFFDAVQKGSIKLQKSPRYTFYEKGISIKEDEDTQIEADIVIFATGFDGVGKIKNIFESPKFGHYIADPPRVGLYRFDTFINSEFWIHIFAPKLDICMNEL